MKRLWRMLLSLLLAGLMSAAPMAVLAEEDTAFPVTIVDQYTADLARGATLDYISYLDDDGNTHTVYYVTVDLGKNSLLLGTPNGKASNTAGYGNTMKDMAGFSTKEGKTVLAAVNGDFYKTSSDGGEEYALYSPLGVMVKDGVWVSDGQREDGAMYFGITADGTAVMGSAEPDGDWDAVKASLYTAIGGELWLVKDGKLNLENISWRTDTGILRARYGDSGRVLDADGSTMEDLSTYPRTCVGILADGSAVLLCADIGYSGSGITIAQEAEIMFSIGCVQAMNLDGGPSTQMLADNGSGLKAVASGYTSEYIGEALLVAAGTVQEIAESTVSAESDAVVASAAESADTASDETDAAEDAVVSSVQEEPKSEKNSFDYLPVILIAALVLTVVALIGLYFDRRKRH